MKKKPYSLSARLIHTLFERCLHLLPPKQPRDISEMIKRLARSTIAFDSKETSLFRIAFDILDAQYSTGTLTEEQFNHAIGRFEAIPGINEMIAELTDNITAEVRAAIAHRDHDSMPGHDSRTLIVACDRPCSADLSELLSISESKIASFKAAVQEWIRIEYHPVDERQISCNERRVRRMDSLARLLALRPNLSACTAVTIDSSALTSRVVIGGNVGTNGDQNTIADAYKHRLGLIKKYINEIKTLHTQTTLSELKKIPENLVNELLSTDGDSKGGSSESREVLIQAATKFLHSMCFDDETFSLDEKRALFIGAPATIVLPEKTSQETMQMKVIHLTPKGSIETSFDIIALQGKKDITVRNIHAEQLLVQYLTEEALPRAEDSIQFLKPPLIVGLTQLCCVTCHEYLQGSEQEIIVRGTHKQTYPRVVNLRNGEQSPHNSGQKTAITRAWPSPILNSADNSRPSKFSISPSTPLPAVPLATPPAPAKPPIPPIHHQATDEQATKYESPPHRLLRLGTPIAATAEFLPKNTPLPKFSALAAQHGLYPHMRGTSRSPSPIDRPVDSSMRRLPRSPSPQDRPVDSSMKKPPRSPSPQDRPLDFSMRKPLRSKVPQDEYIESSPQKMSSA